MTRPIGRVVTGKDVEVAVTASLKKWMPTYLSEVAHQAGLKRGELPLFRSYVSRIDLGSAPEDQLPSCVVVAPGTAGPAEKHGGQFSGYWSVGVGSIVAGRDRDNTYDLCRLYTAATRTALLQHGSLDGFAEFTSWESERYDEFGQGYQNRTLCTGVVHVLVYVRGIVSALGPTEPIEDPGEPYPDDVLVESVLYQVDAKE